MILQTVENNKTDINELEALLKPLPPWQGSY